MDSENQDIVETGATENIATEVEIEQEGQQTETEQPNTEQSEEEKAQQEAEAEQEKKKSRATKRVQDALARAAQAEQKLAEYEAKQNKPSTKPVKPLLENFESYEDFQKELVKFDDDLDEWRISEVERRAQEKQSQKSLIQRQAEFETAMVELESEGVDGAALTKKLETLPPLPIDLHQFGLGAKDTLILAAKLINNDELWLEIAEMNPVQAARRIGQEIDDKPTKPVVRKIPDAPKPITPTSGNSAVKRDYFEQSDDEIMKGI